MRAIWGLRITPFRAAAEHTARCTVSSQSVADLQLRLAHAAARRLGHGQLHEWEHQTGRRGLQLVVLSSSPSSAHRLPAPVRPHGYLPEQTPCARAVRVTCRRMGHCTSVHRKMETGKGRRAHHCRVQTATY